MKEKLLLLAALVFSTLIFSASPAYSAEINVDMSGFIDMSYTRNDNADAAADAEASTFSVDQVEFDFTSKVNEQATATIDLQYVNTGAALTTHDIVEQAYIDVKVKSFTLTFGKFNAPIGAEGGEPTEMLQFSYAQINDCCIPGNLAGVMAAISQGIFELKLYVVNGNDMLLGTLSDDNKEKTFGGRLALTPIKNLTFGVSGITGKENPNPGEQTLTVMDIDLTWTPLEKLTVVGQYNSGSFENAVATGDAKWWGYLAKVNYSFTDVWGVTLRWDSLKDEDGYMLAADEQRDAITAAVSFVVTDNLGGVIEYKSTKSDMKTMSDPDGNAEDTMSTFAAELVYVF